MRVCGRVFQIKPQLPTCFLDILTHSRPHRGLPPHPASRREPHDLAGKGSALSLAGRGTSGPEAAVSSPPVTAPILSKIQVYFDWALHTKSSLKLSRTFYRVLLGASHLFSLNQT